MTHLAYTIFHQLNHLTVDRNSLQHDDRLDAVAGAVEYWNDSLAIDEEIAMRERDMELLDLEIAAYNGEIVGALDATILGIPLDELPQSETEEGWIELQGFENQSLGN